MHTRLSTMYNIRFEFMLSVQQRHLNSILQIDRSQCLWDYLP